MNSKWVTWTPIVVSALAIVASFYSIFAEHTRFSKNSEKNEENMIREESSGFYKTINEYYRLKKDLEKQAQLAKNKEELLQLNMHFLNLSRYYSSSIDKKMMTIQDNLDHSDYFSASQIFISAQRYDKSLYFLDKAINSAQNPREKYLYIRAKGIVLFKQGRIEESRALQKVAIDGSSKLGDDGAILNAANFAITLAALEIGSKNCNESRVSINLVHTLLSRSIDGTFKTALKQREERLESLYKSICSEN